MLTNRDPAKADGAINAETDASTMAIAASSRVNFIATAATRNHSRGASSTRDPLFFAVLQKDVGTAAQRAALLPPSCA